MAYDVDLADRVREVLGSTAAVTEKSMFGGLAFLVAGQMALAVSGRGGLLARVEPDDRDALLARPHVEPAVMGGRTQRGWVRVATEAVESDDALTDWVARGVACVS